ncbi:MAG TPA: aminodeoxychorismate/anthranilate synthase component II [Bacteroidia bacterium]|nr:aminodeoxychorismate/anthranilate synthase component II [Bacteroidia bacterium]
MKVLVFDNYDSFTYNLVHLVEKITGLLPQVVRNDKVSLPEIENYDRIILSPGPGIPREAGLLLPLIKRFAPTKPILGVCLGHQALAEAFGGTLSNLSNVQHGVATEILPSKNPGFLFSGMPEKFKGGLYHSWVVDENTLPGEFMITARDNRNNIMAMQHRQLPVAGVQFHPESILTESGEIVMRNFLLK